MSKMQIYKELSTQKVSTAWIFPLYFQLPYLPEETCFHQGGIFCGGRYRPGCTGIFWSAEGTSQITW